MQAESAPQAPTYERLRTKLSAKYAKQTQFGGRPNQPNIFRKKGLRRYCRIKTAEKQTQFKAKQTQSPKSSNECNLLFHKGL
jgi:hypothetical protein